ncbi:probable metal-nicotianamine transporter YSL5 [Olea europaea var. sylvestris]|uniref:probable metal-nicotianamine transporter YSL5 n=1 Tax=Olea europaea var. sylvestris TaxID=158386 RepID=UPI000C1D8226|nr:probable metal-nicotianamine transporter YSL5 [Olea europaea var. sylvestris]
MDSGRENSVESGVGLHDENIITSEDEELSVGGIFENEEVPSWTKQLTIRAFVVSFVLSAMLCFIVLKLYFSLGIIPPMNVAAGLLGFFFVKTWTKTLEKAGILKQALTRQEVTVIQTCVIASTGIAFSGGFGSYLFGMSERVANQAAEAKYELDYKNPALGWVIGFLFLTSFLGLFSVVPLRKLMIIDLKLVYPSGTTTAYFINSFHALGGAKLAKKQVREFGKFFSFSFLWGFFQWFFTAGDDCGFSKFPTFGLKAYKYTFFFDFSALNVGVGMICPHIVNISFLLGGILSWGILRPLIETRKGDWYSADLEPHNFQGLYGYMVFIGISMFLGDGLYNFFKVLSRTLAGLYYKILCRNTNMQIPVVGNSSPVRKSLSYDDRHCTEVFLKDQIPTWFAVGGYFALAAVSTAILPHIFHQLKWYYIIVIYIFAPSLAFCNAYGCGLTDCSFASNYGKLAVFTIGAWAGASHGGILAGLAACGVLLNIVSTASDLMQDFKTGYLTLASPCSMFVSQVIGTAMGCVISPCVFWIFYKAFSDLGLPTSEYPVPLATVSYNMAKLGVEGLSALPTGCLKLCYGFFAASILINLTRDALGKKRSWFIPIPMAMAVPFFLGSQIAIDMCVGSLIIYVWQKKNKANADAFGPAVATGLICGDGMWTLPKCILALVGVKPPICMMFISRATYNKLD